MSELVNNIINYFQRNISGHLILSIITVFISIVLLIISRRVHRNLKVKAIEKNDDPTHRDITILRIIFDVINILIIILAILTILQVNGVNVSSIITGLGIAGAVLGLAIQDPLKDFIAGIQIVSDRFFKVGDIIKYKDYEGVITSFSLRTTKFVTLDDNITMSISNRNINEIAVIHNPMQQVINVPLSYDEDLDKLNKDLTEIAAIVDSLDIICSCTFKGTDSFDDSSVGYAFLIFNEPMNKKPSYRLALKTIHEELNKRGYVIPYNQIVLHNNK